MKIIIIILALISIAIIAWNFKRKSEDDKGFPPEVVAKAKADKAAREAIRANDPHLFDKISECLFTNDPMGINSETNTYEYEPEVGTIIPRLAFCSSEQDVHNVVYEEFCTWFGDSAGKKENYSKVSTEIWKLWTNKQTQQAN
jgi:hypothetical protein